MFLLYDMQFYKKESQSSNFSRIGERAEKYTFYWSVNGALAWAMDGNSVFGLCSKGTMSLDGEYYFFVESE